MSRKLEMLERAQRELKIAKLHKEDIEQRISNTVTYKPYMQKALNMANAENNFREAEIEFWSNRIKDLKKELLEE